MKLHQYRSALLGSAALSLGCLAAVPAYAQDAGESYGVSEIIVTAQKREQSLQDVPIAVTALGGEALAANRVTNVADLSGLAPGLTPAPTAGGTKVIQFSMRGATGNGVVPGADRTVGIYIDGVYIAASRGAIFDLPDIERVEVLRGPQGTLFGRNATAGAVSISTREPSGEAGVKVQTTVGNYDQFRLGINVELPQVGPFSGYVSYVHNERRGDIRNTAAGQVWDRTSAAVPRLAKVQRSPNYLGSQDTDSWFAALKFESGDFKTVYKYDRLRSIETAPGTGFVGYPTTGSSALTGGVITALINSQDFTVPIASNGKRPKAVANGYVVEGPQRADGHSLTSTYQVSDSVSIKNIFAYRKSFIYGSSALEGFSGLILTDEAVFPLATLYGIGALARAGYDVTDPANAALIQSTIQNIAGGLNFVVGSPFVGVVNQTQGRTSQMSDELQVNYESELLTATAGALWFTAKDRTAETLQQNTPSFTVFPGGVIPNANFGRTFNKVTSLAAYAQLEFHPTDQLDIILGGRVTRDKKNAEFYNGTSVATASLLVDDPFKKTKFNYLVGVNYKPNDDTLVYAKYSTAYVSGGSTGGVFYKPETAKSWEGGVKASLLNNKLQANLAVYHVKYKSVQGANSTTTPGTAEIITELTGDPTRAATIGTFTFNNGDLTAKGFEFDFTAAPVRGLTFGGSLGYTDATFSNVFAPILAANDGRYDQIFTPDWTGNFWAQYDTNPVAGDAYVSFRVDGRWQSDMTLNANNTTAEYTSPDGYARSIGEVPSYWVFNSRIALKELDIGGIDTELAFWGKNLTNNKSINYALSLGFAGAANYIPARTYGLDLTVQF